MDTPFNIGGGGASVSDIQCTGNCALMHENDEPYLKISTSGTVTPIKNMTVDVFLVGGGGGGGGTTGSATSGSGGGGGYTLTITKTLQKDTLYNVVIGAGGAAGKNGGQTSFDTIVVNGGKSGTLGGKGGNGGSGGGSYAGETVGGTDGGNGAGGTYGGTGQGSTTRPFGTYSTPYAGGGGGPKAAGGYYGGGRGADPNASNGTKGLDGFGGGGGAGSGYKTGWAGGSGAVLIRIHK